MARTQVRSRQILDGGVKKDDLNVNTPGQAVITKVSTNQGLQLLSSTGIDTGTGDVTIGLSFKLNNATTDPTILDDINNGFTVNSRWINTATKEEFVCVDSSGGAAVWLNTTHTATDSINDAVVMAIALG